MKFFLFLLLSLNTFAIPSGVYSNEGTAILNGREMSCDMVEIRFIHENEKFTLRGGGYRCGEIQAEYPYSVFQINNGELYYQGEKVGYIGDDYFSLAYEEFSLDIKFENNHIYYNELWQDGEDYFQVLGELEANDSFRN